MTLRTATEITLYNNLKRAVHYAACLERECGRLSGELGIPSAIDDPRNVTLTELRSALTAVDGRDR